MVPPCHNGDTSNIASPIQNMDEWNKEVNSLRINPEDLKSVCLFLGILLYYMLL